jgi:hypothetical protein
MSSAGISMYAAHVSMLPVKSGQSAHVALLDFIYFTSNFNISLLKSLKPLNTFKSKAFHYIYSTGFPL